MGKSLVDMINNIGGKTHTRHYDICGGVAYNSTYQTEIDDESCSNILEVNGEGRIVAILPMLPSSNTSFYGQMKVFTDNNKVLSAPAYWHYQRIYGFLFGASEHRNFSDADVNVGIYIPELNTVNYTYNGAYRVPYISSKCDEYMKNSNGNYPIVYDDSNGSKEFTFKDGFKILASQANSTSYVDNHTKVLVIYDLYD